MQSKSGSRSTASTRTRAGTSSVSNLILIVAVTLGGIGALSNIGDSSEKLVSDRTTSDASAMALGPTSMAGTGLNTQRDIELGTTSNAGIGDPNPDINDIDGSDTSNGGAGQDFGATGNETSFASCENCLSPRDDPSFFDQVLQASAEFGHDFADSVFGVHARPNAPDFNKIYGDLASNDGQRWLSPFGVIGGAAMTALSALRTGVSLVLDSMYYPFMSPEQRFANTRDAAESTVWFAQSTGAYARLLWETVTAPFTHRTDGSGGGSDTAKGLAPSSQATKPPRPDDGFSIELGDRVSFARLIDELGVQPENSVYRSKERLLFSGKEHVAIEVSGEHLSGEYTIEAWHTPRKGASEQLFSETFEIEGKTTAEREASFASQVADFRAQALEQSDLDNMTVWNGHRWEDYENAQTGAKQRVETVNSALNRTWVHSHVTVTNTSRGGIETVVELENKMSFDALEKHPRYRVVEIDSN